MPSVNISDNSRMIDAIKNPPTKKKKMTLKDLFIRVKKKIKKSPAKRSAKKRKSKSRY